MLYLAYKQFKSLLPSCRGLSIGWNSRLMKYLTHASLIHELRKSKVKKIKRNIYSQYLILCGLVSI